MIYDSRVGFLDLKALCLKEQFECEGKRKLIAYMKPLMINATDRNTINLDNYQFYFNKLLTLKNIKIQNDVLTKEMVKANDFRLVSTVLGIISPGFMIYNYLYPDTTIKTAGYVAMGASSMLSRASTLVNYGYGEDLQSSLADDLQEEYIDQGSCFVDEEMGILNREGGMFLTGLYGNNKEFREEIINFVRDKKN